MISMRILWNVIFTACNKIVVQIFEKKFVIVY